MSRGIMTSNLRRRGKPAGHVVVTTPQHGYLGHKDMHLRRLKRIEGQVRGLERMVDEEKYCIDILTQVSAVTSALKSVSLELLAEHMSHCVARAAQAGGQEAEDKITEANQAIARLSKPDGKHAWRNNAQDLHHQWNDLRALR